MKPRDTQRIAGQYSGLDSCSPSRVPPVVSHVPSADPIIWASGGERNPSIFSGGDTGASNTSILFSGVRGLCHRPVLHYPQSSPATLTIKT